MDLVIKGFHETSFIDWDGKIVSVVYVGSCNMRCSFCHNSGLVLHPQNYETIPLEKIENFLMERKDFIDGICLTGGEPCLHKEKGLFEFLRRVKALGLLIKIDTNGTDPACLKEIIQQKLADYFAMDIKAPLDEKYAQLTGVKINLDFIRQSITILMHSGLPYEFRTTVVPGMLDTEDIKKIAAAIAGAEKFVLQQFSPENCWDESLRSVVPYGIEKLTEMRTAAGQYVSNTVLRGA
ncbi:MAG: anaerobic ribonucleoside-triphosphate reductase activating protein [Candidatus Margulisiibacteriota bacterium]